MENWAAKQNLTPTLHRKDPGDRERYLSYKDNRHGSVKVLWVIYQFEFIIEKFNTPVSKLTGCYNYGSHWFLNVIINFTSALG